MYEQLDCFFGDGRRLLPQFNLYLITRWPVLLGIFSSPPLTISSISPPPFPGRLPLLLVFPHTFSSRYLTFPDIRRQNAVPPILVRWAFVADGVAAAKPRQTRDDARASAHCRMRWCRSSRVPPCRRIPRVIGHPAVAPFWHEFRDNFLFRSPGHLFEPRVECEYIQALFSTISYSDGLVYSSADTSGRPLNRTNWTPRQHYLRFMCSIAHYHSTSGIMSNPDIWPNFEDNGQRDPSMSQGYQACVTLGFLIVREQLNHPSRSSSPSSSFHGRPRTPDQSRRSLREPTATPEFPMRRVHMRHPNATTPTAATWTTAT